MRFTNPLNRAPLFTGFSASPARDASVRPWLYYILLNSLPSSPITLILVIETGLRVCLQIDLLCHWLSHAPLLLRVDFSVSRGRAPLSEHDRDKQGDLFLSFACLREGDKWQRSWHISFGSELLMCKIKCLYGVIGADPGVNGLEHLCSAACLNRRGLQVVWWGRFIEGGG